jgi:hypothetical protein
MTPELELLFETQITNVSKNISSIYSKEDVVIILKTLRQYIDELPEEVKDVRGLTAFKLDVVQAFRHELDDNRYGEYVDQDSAEFQVSYDNRIELSNIDINVEELENALERAFERVEAGN